MTFIDGTTYEGSWLEGKFHGQGSLSYNETNLLNAFQLASIGNLTISDVDGSNASEAVAEADLKREMDTLKAQAQSQKFLHSQQQAFTLLKKTLHVENVHLYQGQFERGVANGMATIMFANQASSDDIKYEGMVKSGCLNGIG